MISMDKTAKMLDEIASVLPKEFYKKLNGGILLLPEMKMHPENEHSNSANLYIMGQYNYSSSMGRYITIYYGSFAKLYGNLAEEIYKEKLRETLLHEFTHHIESLAGDRSLEIKDKEKLERYRKDIWSSNID